MKQITVQPPYTVGQHLRSRLHASSPSRGPLLLKVTSTLTFYGNSYLACLQFYHLSLHRLTRQFSFACFFLFIVLLFSVSFISTLFLNYFILLYLNLHCFLSHFERWTLISFIRRLCSFQTPVYTFEMKCFPLNTASPVSPTKFDMKYFHYHSVKTIL